MQQPEWLDQPDGEDPPRRSRRRPALLIAASVPWLLVVALLVLPDRLGSDVDGEHTPDADGELAEDQRDPSSMGAEVPGADGGHGPADAGEPSDAGTDPLVAATPDLDDGVITAVEVRGLWRIEPGLEEAAALAMVVARAWLTGLAPVLTLDAVPPDRSGHGYAEHLVVEAVEQPAEGAAVVTIVAIVLDGEDLDPVVRRLAVPIALSAGGPRSAGAPWELPPPALDPVELAREPIDDPDLLLAAADALRLAGLTDHTLLELHRTNGWPVLATVDAPGGAAPTVVWLREHVGGFVVSGTTLAGHGAAHPPPDIGDGNPPGVADTDQGTNDPDGDTDDGAGTQETSS